MNKILFINACARENSRTLELVKHILGTLDGEITEVRLYELGLTPLDEEGYGRYRLQLR